MGKTAAAIAAGDLSRRVEPEDEPHRGRPARPRPQPDARAHRGRGHRPRPLAAGARSSESKLRRFVADASHELRTPLAAVRAYAELFTRGAASRPDDLERSMKGISRESERMSVLVEDLLLLAHLDEGRPLAREPVPLDAVVAEAVETGEDARAGPPDRGRSSCRARRARRPRPPPPGRRQPARERPRAHAGRRPRSA